MSMCVTYWRYELQERVPCDYLHRNMISDEQTKRKCDARWG